MACGHKRFFVRIKATANFASSVLEEAFFQLG